MVSFINVDGCLVDAQGRVWSNLVAASYPKTSGRRDGAVRIGSIDAATNKVTWLNANDIKFPGRFLYSCLTQVDGDKMAIVYEQQEPKSDGTQDVIFNQFSLLDLLGEGWSYSAATPALAVSNMVEALDVDEEIELSAAVDGVDAVDSCLDTYDTEAAAEQQKDLLDNAAKKLFRAQRDLAAKPLPEPDPEPQPQPQPQPQPDRDNIKVETDEAGNKVTTTTHKDGTSTVDITAPDGVSTTIELDKDGDATAISATVPASVAKSGRATLPLKHAIAGASSADAPAITIDIAGAAPARPLQVSLDSQDGELAPGTVAVLVDANGNEKVLAKTALANNRVSFPIENDATIKIVDRGKSFEDVRETDWFAQEVIGYASARGIINGVPGKRGALQFQGNAAASRAMFVCMLANLEDARQDQPQSAFTDVAQSD